MESADVQEHYDSLDAVYRAVWGESLHHGVWERGVGSPDEAIANHQQRVMREVEANGIPKRVVDIGCGYGVLSRLMRERWMGDVLGVTNSPVQYRRCMDVGGAGNGRDLRWQSERATQGARASRPFGWLSRFSQPPEPSIQIVPFGGIRFVCGDWLELRNESSFDAAVAVEMSGHVADLMKFFEVTAQRMNEGGLLVMTDIFQAAVRNEKRIAAIVRDGRFAALRSVNDVVDAATCAGWNLIRIDDWTMETAPTWGVMQRRMFSRAWRSAGVWRAAMNTRSLADLRVWAIPRMIRAYRAGNLEYSLLIFRKGDRVI